MAKPGGKFVGVDVGGTKILATLVTSEGMVLGRKRLPTPHVKSSTGVIAAVAEAIGGALKKAGASAVDITAIGLAVPGVVEPGTGRVLVAPNVNLGGLAVVKELARHFRAPIALGNDVNLGTLGEKWLGAARADDSVVGIFVGTGIGGGIILDGRLVEGSRGAAAEVGHMVMQLGGPACGCGNQGCLEALASRLAIERELRAAIAKGRKTLVSELIKGQPGPIRSSVLQEALEDKDKLTISVLKKAAEVLGAACVNLIHVLDPQAVVLGGGVMEACGDFILPIVQAVVAKDPLMKGRAPAPVLEAALGDDAVALGAAAIALRLVGRDPLAQKNRAPVRMPRVRLMGEDVIIGGKRFAKDVYLRVDGSIKKRKKGDDGGRKKYREISAALMAKVCRGGPAVVYVATGRSGGAKVTDEAAALLKRRNIALLAAPSARAIAQFNSSKERRAILVHLD